MDKSMKAAVFMRPNKIEVKDVPIPEIGSKEYLLRVTACGLCKTDIKKIKGVTLKSKGVLKPPRVFGHEIVGTIEKLGEVLHNGLKVGDRVMIYHHVPCLKCYYCLNGNHAQCDTYKSIDTTAGVGEPSGGGFAQFVRVPRLIAERGTVKIPDHVDDEKATFVEPTNCCLKAIRKSNIQTGDSVAVFGQGPVGIKINQLVKLRGGNVISVDLVDYRLEKSREYGADHTVNALHKNLKEMIQDLTEGRGVDVTIVAVESPKAVEQAIDITRAGGTVVFFAEYGGEVGADVLGEMVDFVYGKEITIHGCYSSSYLDHQIAADLVFNDKIKTTELISHTYGLDKLLDAVNLAEKRKSKGWEGEKIGDRAQESFKIIIKPWE
jgi:L-iditol 2-dehydrogenase